MSPKQNTSGTSVSIALAAYNGEQHLHRQLESIAVQTRLPEELVVTDDCSDDRTPLIIEEFARTAPFPVHLHRNQSRLGYRRNFMLAASLCSSQLIAFCDQDDKWYPHKLEFCVERFTEPDILLTYHNADVVSNDDRKIGSLEPSAAKQSVLAPMSFQPMVHVLGFTTVFRRSLLQFSELWPMSVDHLHPTEPMAHDQWFFFFASALGKICYIDEPLVAYVQHGRNVFGWNTSPSQRRKLASIAKNNASLYSQHAMFLERRARLLTDAGERLDGIWKNRAKIASENYKRLSDCYTSRGALYTSSGLNDRINAFRELVTNDAYKGSWGLGVEAFVKDLCLGVPVGPRLRPASEADTVRWW
jgi:glycosyltransferase involved in cell wall biosynthesis